MTDLPDDSIPQGRRDFFRKALFKALRPAADYLEKKLPPALRNLADASDVAERLVVLRPPGARRESEFLETCFRCGSCADHCPADSISLLKTADERMKGTPYVDASLRACVICNDLSCMKVCPSGALQLVDRLDIRMGFALVDHETCVRSKGEDCTICVEVCPIGKEAIRVGVDGRIEVIDPSCTGVGCTGCGLCQERCPTRPVRAIVVRPYSTR